jgi:hypothetical protein
MWQPAGLLRHQNGPNVTTNYRVFRQGQLDPFGSCLQTQKNPGTDASGHRERDADLLFRPEGVPIRDRTGLEFATTGGAIEHSKELARRLRRDPRIRDRSFSIVVIDESGAEVHREPVYLDGPQAGAA